MWSENTALDLSCATGGEWAAEVTSASEWSAFLGFSFDWQGNPIAFWLILPSWLARTQTAHDKTLMHNQLHSEYSFALAVRLFAKVSLKSWISQADVSSFAPVCV